MLVALGSSGWNHDVLILYIFPDPVCIKYEPTTKIKSI